MRYASNGDVLPAMGFGKNGEFVHALREITTIITSGSYDAGVN